ncbi:MAG TPA: hypothetical protein VGU20_20305 [Stellaceae bacterium]|nr:hypothetical protein [Stellaceae bacterium]
MPGSDDQLESQKPTTGARVIEPVLAERDRGAGRTGEREEDIFRDLQRWGPGWANARSAQLDLWRHAYSPMDFYRAIDFGLSQTYEHLRLVDRVQYASVELILAAVYSYFLAAFLVSHGDVVAHLVSFSWWIIAPPALAQSSQGQSVAIRDALAVIFALGVLITLLLTAFAALIRQPPSRDAKELLRYQLGFVTGSILTFVGLK